MKKIVLICMAFLITTGLYAQQNIYSSTNGIAIKGYDPVAYFLQSKAMEGKEEFTYEWSGSKWKFVSEANLNSFKAAPEKYAPQFGGFCAYGCSENHKSPTDPNAWTIVNNKLYLNYNLKVKEMWIKDTASRIPAAVAYWKTN